MAPVIQTWSAVMKTPAIMLDQSSNGAFSCVATTDLLLARLEVAHRLLGIGVRHT